MAFAGRDPAEVVQMVSTNAAGLYGFDLDALAPLASEVGPRVEEVARPIAAVEIPTDSYSPALTLGSLGAMASA